MSKKTLPGMRAENAQKRQNFRRKTTMALPNMQVVFHAEKPRLATTQILQSVFALDNARARACRSCA